MGRSHRPHSSCCGFPDGGQDGEGLEQLASGFAERVVMLLWARHGHSPRAWWRLPAAVVGFVSCGRLGDRPGRRLLGKWDVGQVENGRGWCRSKPARGGRGDRTQRLGGAQGGFGLVVALLGLPQGCQRVGQAGQVEQEHEHGEGVLVARQAPHEVDQA